jgi:hypothetical protein
MQADDAKLFGAGRKPAEAGPFPFTAPAAFALAEEGGKSRRWLKPLITTCCVLLIAGVCAEAYRRVTIFGTRVVQAHPVDARIELSNPPAWLDRRIVNALLEEAYQFAQRDDTTYQRARDILDKKVLEEFAELYTGVDSSGGKPVDRQALGFNAWIKCITQVRRNIAKDKSIQTIQIFAEWREPAAWVRVGPGDEMCLIDREGVRLPGEYHAADRAHSPLMVISGMDLPMVDGRRAIPRPGQRWSTGENDSVGDDLVAGMRLAEKLQSQRYANQIGSIDVSNFAGRKDAREPWIVFETIWAGADGSPRVVQWGRPIGEEKIYEVQAPRKLKALSDLYLRYARIDADRDIVDIRTEVVLLSEPSPKPEDNLATPVKPPRVTAANY